MHYTIVLTPTIQSEKYIETAQSLYANLNPSYLLNQEGTSSPHITVVQFDCSEDVALQVWKAMCNQMETQNIPSFAPPFSGVSFIEGVGLYKDTTWVELAVKRGDENSPIMKVHSAALSILQSFNIKPLNAVGNDYRPHLTLARIALPKELKTWPRSLFEDIGPFHLEFGMSDEQWQYAKSLGTCELGFP